MLKKTFIFLSMSLCFMQAAAAQERGVPVRSLGAILSTANQSEFTRRLQEIVSVATRSDLPLETIYWIGDKWLPQDEETLRLMRAVFVLDGTLVPLNTLPPQYIKIKQQPAWLINLSGGQIILEAPPNLADYISAHGEFIEKPYIAAKELREVGSETPTPKTASAKPEIGNF